MNIILKTLITSALLVGVLNAQTLKFTQIEKASGNGSVVITTGTNNVLTYTNSLPASLIPTLSAYVPYSGATTSVNLGANTLSVGIIKSATVAVASPSNGWQWYDPTLNAFTWYHNSNGSAYSAVFTNSVFGLGIYNVAATSGLYNCQLVTTNTTGIALSPNGNISFAVSTNSVYTTKRTHIGGSTDITHTLQVSGGANVTTTLNVGTGTSIGNTITVGNTNTLTGGNSGTIAVLSDAVFAITFSPVNFNIADAGTYYFGNLNYPPQTFAATMGTVALPYNCTLVAWTFDYYLGGTTGSGESSTLYIRKNNTTDYTLSSAITFSSSSATGFSGSGLTENYAAGDRINGKVLAATFATNPTQVYFGLTLFFVRRL